MIPCVHTQSGWNTSRQSRGQQLGELVGLPGQLPAGDPDADPPPQLGDPGVVAAVQRLLHPVHLLGREGVGDLGRPLDVPRRPDVPRHPPALVAVDHQLERVADGVAHGADDGEVVGQVGPPEAHLQRREAELRHTPCASATISSTGRWTPDEA